jgi:hypothetical protein
VILYQVPDGDIEVSLKRTEPELTQSETFEASIMKGPLDVAAFSTEYEVAPEEPVQRRPPATEEVDSRSCGAGKGASRRYGDCNAVVETGKPAGIN